MGPDNRQRATAWTTWTWQGVWQQHKPSTRAHHGGKAGGWRQAHSLSPLPTHVSHIYNLPRHVSLQLPQDIFPFFRQYYDYRQVEAFGSDVMFIPLGSRAEFPDIVPEQVKVATKRYALGKRWQLLPPPLFPRDWRMLAVGLILFGHALAFLP